MAGEIKRLIDEIIRQRSKGDPFIASTTKTRLILKGIVPERYTESSDDDPAVITKVRQVAQDMGVELRIEP